MKISTTCDYQSQYINRHMLSSHTEVFRKNKKKQHENTQNQKKKKFRMNFKDSTGHK